MRAATSRPPPHLATPRPGSGHLAPLAAPTVYLWFAVALVVAVPLVFDPGGYLTFLPVKWAVASSCVAAGIAAAVVQRARIAWTAPTVAWLALLAVIVAAATLGVGGLTSWIGYPGRYLGVLAWLTFFGAFVLGSTLHGAKQRAVVAAYAAGASVVVSTYALLQAVGVDPIRWSSEIDASRTRSTLGNAAFLGAYLAMVAPLAARLAMSGGQPRLRRAVDSVAALLAVAALATTQTRGAWLGALAGGALLVVVELPRLRARKAVTIGAAALGVTFLVLLATVSPLAGRIQSVGDASSGTGHGRLIQWDLTLHSVAHRPLLGWGPDTYVFTFPRVISPQFERDVGRSTVPDRAHNVVLDMASDTGVLGAGAYVVLLTLIATRFVRRRSRDPVTVGLAAACLAYVVQLQFSFPLADLDTVFWLFAGLLVASSDAVTRTVARAWAALPAAAAVAFALWGSLDVAADHTLRSALNAEAHGRTAAAQQQADRAARLGLWRAQYDQAAARLHLRAAATSGQATDFGRALTSVDAALRLVPRDLEYRLDRGDVYLAWGEATGDKTFTQRAADQFRDILRADPHSSRVHLDLGVADAELGRNADAEQEWRTTVGLSPSSAGPHLDLGLLYAQQGRTAQARVELKRALALEPSNTVARAALDRLGP